MSVTCKKIRFCHAKLQNSQCFEIELRNYFLFDTLCFALNQIPTDKSKHQYYSQGMSHLSELNIGYFTLSIPCLVAQCFSIRSLYCVLTVDKFKFMGQNFLLLLIFQFLVTIEIPDLKSTGLTSCHNQLLPARAIPKYIVNCPTQYQMKISYIDCWSVSGR